MFGQDENEENQNKIQQTNDDLIKDNHLPTGIKRLDEEHPNGYPAGSLIVVMGDERSMSNLFGLHLAATGQPTQYLTTLRSPKLIREEIEEINSDIDDSLQFTDMFRNADDHSALIKTTLNQLQKHENLILESINEVNFSDNATYRKIIRKISKKIRSETIQGIALLHLQKSEIANLTETERQLLNIADIVFSVETAKVGGDLENDLKIYKMRGIPKMPTQVFKIKLGNSIRIDTARDI